MGFFLPCLLLLFLPWFHRAALSSRVEPLYIPVRGTPATSGSFDETESRCRRPAELDFVFRSPLSLCSPPCCCRTLGLRDFNSAQVVGLRRRAKVAAPSSSPAPPAAAKSDPTPARQAASVSVAISETLINHRAQRRRPRLMKERCVLGGRRAIHRVLFCRVI